jgi:hypothetical protein
MSFEICAAKIRFSGFKWTIKLNLSRGRLTGGYSGQANDETAEAQSRKE